MDMYLSRGDDQVKLTVQERMKSLSARLKGKGFLQVHRMWLVNMSAVIEDHPYPKTTIHLVNGIEIPLARRRKLDFLAAYRSRD